MARFRFETRIDIDAKDLKSAYSELYEIIRANDDVIPWWGVFDVWDEDGKVANPSEVGIAILAKRKPK